ncbi:class A beta-lactamase [Pokkaliibacter sp. CJK22405]|uniref:class A beta-lactamase n=1 Tax=Pokkaliibacter sp. CJK22405 TaxID=3384615 RepID=UPI003984703F
MPSSRRQFLGHSSLLILAALSGGTLSPLTLAAEQTSLAEAVRNGERKLQGKIGVSLFDTGTGMGWSHRGSERFSMCSTFKVLACGAILQRVDEGTLSLSQRLSFSQQDVVNYSPISKAFAGKPDGMSLGEICHAAMTYSDNTAANLIIGQLGGPQAVTDFARSIGDDVSRLDRWETALNTAIDNDPRDTTTPEAMTSNLQRLLLGDVLSKESQQQLGQWLRDNTTGASRIRKGVPNTWQVGDKTGSGDNGTANDVAILWPPGQKPLLLSVYITQAKSDWDACSAVIAEISAAIAAEYSARHKPLTSA